MARPSSDRLRRLEVLLLTAGAVTASVLLALQAGDDLGHATLAARSGALAAVYAFKLLLMEAALLAPFTVLALLGRALFRETGQSPYRWVGLGISLAASLGVVVALWAGHAPLDLGRAVDTLVAHVVPPMLLLSACALLYGGLIWLAQHRRLTPFSPDEAPPTSPRPRA